MKRISKEEYYLGIAIAVSARGTCLHRRYGCVIVKDDIVVATGYNGSPRGKDNCCDRGQCQREVFAVRKEHGGYDKCSAVHAEQNALIAAKRTDLEGATLYLTCEENIDGEWVEEIMPTPCNICSNMIRNAGITRIVTRSTTYVCD